MMVMFFILSNLMMIEFSTKLFLFWFLMELNTISFIFISLKKNNFQMFYLIISMFSSFIFMFFILFSKFKLLLMVSMMIKIGIFPFFSWLFKMVKITPKNYFLLLLSVQKIPLIIFLLNLNFMFSINLEILIFMNMLFCLFFSFFSMNMIFNLMILSLYSNSMILFLAELKLNLMLVYMYFFLMDLMLIFLEKMKNLNLIMKKSVKISIFLIMISMLNFPFYPNFLVKVLIFIGTINLLNKLMILMFMILMIFIYMMIMKLLMMLTLMKFEISLKLLVYICLYAMFSIFMFIL